MGSLGLFYTVAALPETTEQYLSLGHQLFILISTFLSREREREREIGRSVIVQGGLDAHLWVVGKVRCFVTINLFCGLS